MAAFLILANLFVFRRLRPTGFLYIIVVVFNVTVSELVIKFSCNISTFGKFQNVYTEYS